MVALTARHNAIDLAHGGPEFACSPEVKRAATTAIDTDLNRYGPPSGNPDIRTALTAKMRNLYPDWPIDPDTDICITCGATEAMVAALHAVVNPGDQVIVFEPFYDNYEPWLQMVSAEPVFVRLHSPTWEFDEDDLRAAFTSRTHAILVNSPHNPTGKVFGRAELELISTLCQRHNVICITDEVYEHIVYEDGGPHIPPATIPGLADRTISVSSLSKTYATPGWRIGWTIAPPPLTLAITKIHDLLTACAPTPLQTGAATALTLPTDYYTDLARDYRQRRDILCKPLSASGFRFVEPHGACYVMADYSQLRPDLDDDQFAHRLITHAGVAGVPGSAFFAARKTDQQLIRFAFPRHIDTLHTAAHRLTAAAPLL
uniref:pyridoxal phosphate-dependent aminotransferase n=1 Tax=Nocardia suismassiliense TaxID=2077092 RepID=UPI003F49837D